MDADLRDLLQHSALVERPTTSEEVDFYGNKKKTWNAVGTFPCKIEELSGNEDTNDRNVHIGRWRAIFDTGTGVQVIDRLTLPSSRQFEITHIVERYDIDGSEHHRVAYLREVDGVI